MGIFKRKNAEATQAVHAEQHAASTTLQTTDGGGRSNADILYTFGQSDHWTLEDALSGTQVFGATGSGKTSGSGRALAMSFLNRGYGGLVLCAKPDERENWERYLRDATPSRAADAIVIDASCKERFNFVAHEQSRIGSGGGIALQIATVIATATETGQQTTSRDPYWDLAARELLVNTVDLIDMAGLPMTMTSIVDVIRGAPPSRADAAKVWTPASGYDTTYLWGRLLSTAHARSDREGVGRLRDFEQMRSYWLADLPSLALTTRASVVSTLTSKLAGLLRSPLRELFSSDTTVKPIESRTGRGEKSRGSVIIVDLPVKQFGETGRLAQVLFKTAWQRDIESHADTSRPVFLWADEAQYFATRHDMLFQQTARSARCATVYLTQNLPNYYAMLDGGNATCTTDSLLGNLQTKIFHANGDPTTNQWAEAVFGSDMQQNVALHSGQGGPGSSSLSQELRPTVLAVEFTRLKRGGHSFGRKVEAFVYGGGRVWNETSKGWVRATFDQP